MLVPLSWLNDYVDINVSADELEKKLFDCGFEVEEKWQVGKDISGIVVGYVESCEPIPETHLHVCQVNVGGPELLQICCGADNVKAGGKFPVAMIGAQVYATAKDHVTIEGVVTIKKGKLRGYESYGMLCSGTELGLNEDLYPGAGYNGLLVLPEDAEIGADVKEITGLNDWIFDVSITANRPDCQSIFGLAREVAAALGQPLHAFDCDYLEGNAICIRRATEGEKIVTLDEKEFTLNTNNLVICDGKKPVALAGIMGGLNSEIRDTTTEVMFEAAKFARDNIRKSSRALGQSSDASQRYAKGVDEYATEMAMKRALHLVEELGAGKVSKTHKNVNTGNSLEPKTFKTSIKKVNGVLGITVPDEDILRILKGLDFDPEINGDELTLHFPAYREDMEDYPDVAEEVIRMYGYDHINSTFLPTAKVTIGGTNMRQKTILKVKRALCSVGAFEGMHYSFFSPADLDEMEFPEDALERKAIRIMNPINEDLSLMRTTLAPQMIHAMGRNQKRGIFEGRIFEIGNAFIPKSLPLTEYPEERETLCIGAFGKDESFFTLKGMAETVADVLHLTFTYERTEKPFLHPYRTAAILCEGEVVGYLGQVKYEIMKAEAMREDAYVLEINMKALEKWYGKAPVFEPLPKFAEEKRDLALVMNKDITCGQVEECIYQACSFVKDVTLFDVYEGQQIAEDKKSMAFTVLFTPKEEAFQADTVDGYVKKILKQLKKAYEIELRS